MSAVISPCGRYRYKLSRDFPGLPIRRIVWVMLNPSTADAVKNDRTIDAICAFSMQWCFTRIDVVNLYALRARDPRELWRCEDPVGPENDQWIRTTCAEADKVVCAWGGQGAPDRVLAVARVLPLTNCWALGRNRDGSPKHPLYVRRDTPLVPFP